MQMKIKAYVKRAAYCYLAAMFVQFLVFINLDGNQGIFRGDQVFGDWMIVLQFLFMPLMPIGHIVVFCAGILSGEGSRSGIPVLVFFISFLLAWWVAKATTGKPRHTDQKGTEGGQ